MICTKNIDKNESCPINLGFEMAFCIIIDEPTIGVDISAKRAIHDLIWRLAKEEGILTSAKK